MRTALYVICAGLSAYCNSATSSERREISSPLPKFATQPSATTLYCKSRAWASLTAGDPGEAKDSPPVATIVGKLDTVEAKSDTSTLRIRFEVKAVQVAVALGVDGKASFGPDFRYEVLHDQPTNFFAMADRTFNGGGTFTIGMNRLTGTMVFSTVYASLPEGAHPFAGVAFYTCSPSP